MNTRKKKTRKKPVVPCRRVKSETIVRTELERAKLARDATRLKRAGLTYRQIAERLACSPGMVHKLVHEGIDAYTAEAKIEAGEMVETIIADLLKSSQELWIEWERSKQNRERTTKKTISGKRKPQVTELVEPRCGDPRIHGRVQGEHGDDRQAAGRPEGREVGGSQGQERTDGGDSRAERARALGGIRSTDSGGLRAAARRKRSKTVIATAHPEIDTPGRKAER